MACVSSGRKQKCSMVRTNKENPLGRLNGRWCGVNVRCGRNVVGREGG